MREIEVKARVADKQQLLGQLQRQSVTLSEPATQSDTVFGLKDVSGGDDHNTHPWLRIRVETTNNQTKTYFTLKRSVTNQLDSIEHETVVENAQETRQIINQLGFDLYTEITKTRQKAHIGAIELCIDHVEGLGDFIEAEMLTDDDADYNAIVGQLWASLESVGVSKTDEVTDGYDTLMRHKQGLVN